MQERTPTTNFDFIPTPGNVLLSVEYELPFIAFAQKEIKPPVAIYKVQGYGISTSIELNSIVQVNSDYRNPFAFAVNIPTNSKSYKVYSIVAKSLPSEEQKKLTTSGKRFKVIDFICIPEYGITGYFNEDTTCHSIIKDHGLDHIVDRTIFDTNVSN